VSLAPCPTSVLWDRINIPLPPPLLVLDYSLLFAFQFCWGGGSVCLGAVLDYFPWESWYRSLLWYMMLICLFCNFMQAALELADGRNGSIFFLSVA
jgi:hypothetical protein